jgi:hypothetical protein
VCHLQVKELLVKKLQEEGAQGGAPQGSKRGDEEEVVAMMEALDCEVEGCVRIGYVAPLHRACCQYPLTPLPFAARE